MWGYMYLRNCKYQTNFLSGRIHQSTASVIRWSFVIQILNNCILDLISLLIRFIISIQISSMASFWRVAISRGLGGGGGGLGLIFAGFVPLASQSPYPIMVYSMANYRPHPSHFWANVYFLRSQLSHFLFLWIDPFSWLNEEHFTFHLRYKHSKILKCATPLKLLYWKCDLVIACSAGVFWVDETWIVFVILL